MCDAQKASHHFSAVDAQFHSSGWRTRLYCDTYRGVTVNMFTRHSNSTLPGQGRSNGKRYHGVIFLSLLFVTRAGAAPAATGSIPFELVRNSVFAQVSVDGHEACDMLIDTGADPSIVDLKVARQIGLKLSGGSQGEGGGNDVNIGYPTTLRQIKLGM